MPEPLRSSIVVDAPPERVFPYFTLPEAIVRWMGDYARLDAVPGGEFTVDINGVPVRGRYLEVEPPHRLVISWGHAGSDRFPPGSSRLEVELVAVGAATRVEITHSGLPEPQAGGYGSGWEHFLARLAVAGAGGDPGRDPFATRP